MSIFKGTFSPEVKSQLLIRGGAIKNRTPQGLQFFNGRNAWARMSSGVNISGSILNDNTLALSNVLFGGTIIHDQLTNTDIIPTGLSTGSDWLGAYGSSIEDANKTRNQYQRGIRPMAGITSIDIKSKSAYGSLREATVNFVCHDIKQLEILELLYMRPGFTVLLEWGWAPYLDDKGNLKSTFEYYERMWEQNNSLSLQDRFKELFQKSKTYFGNYDAMLGYVKNYEWTARYDGGFDCRTEIITVGEIIESLKINYAPVFLPQYINGTLLGLTPFNQDNFAKQTLSNYTPQIKIFYEKGYLAGILSELIYYGYTKTNGKNANNGIAFHLIDDGTVSGTPGKRMDFFRIKMQNKNSKTSTDQKNNMSDEDHVYIDFETFIGILNKYIILSDKKTNTPLVPLSLKDREYIEDTTTPTKDLLCLSHPLQISVDPTICLIKTPYYFNLNKIKVDAKGLQSVYPKDDKNIAIRTEAEGIIKKYNETAIQTSVEQRTSIRVLTGYFDKLQKQNISFREAAIFLSDAFESYKQKTAAVDTNALNSNNSTFVDVFKYSIGNDMAYETAPKNEPTSQETAKRIVASKSFGDILLRDLNETNLKTFLQKYITLTNDDVKKTTRDTFTPTQSVHTIASDNVLKQFETTENQSINQAVSEEASKNLTFLNNPELKDYFVKIGEKQFGLIGGVYVNLGYALYLILNSQLEGQDVKEKKEINLYDYLKSLTKGIQESIGSLNNFEIHVDPIDNIARIIDIHYIDTKNTFDAYNNSFMFLSPDQQNVDGNFNNIRNYKISSKIFKEQSTIVAISAQNGGGEIGLDNETLVGWNRGLKDRILPDKGVPQGPSSVDEKTQILANLNGSTIILKNFITDLGWSKTTLLGFTLGINERVYNSEESERYKNALRDIIMSYKALTKCDAKFKSIIPTKLTIEMDGIGGLVIGNLFRMPDDIIPMGYKINNNIGRRIGYIVTGIHHNITNDWITKIDALFTVMEEPEGNIFDIVNVMSDNNIKEIDINIAPKDKSDVKVIKQSNNEGNIPITINFLKQKGYTNFAIAGIVGNLLQESDLNPNAFNPNDKGQPAEGIAQWRAERRTSLITNTGYKDLNFQLEFLHKEIVNDKKSYDSIQKAISAQDAAFDFDKYFERSDGSTRTVRMAIASYIYDKYLKG